MTEISISELISNWLVSRRSPSTLATYRYGMDSFTEFLGRDPLPVTQPEIQRWVNHLREVEGKSPRTIANYRSAVSSFLDYAISQGVVKDNPAKRVTVPKAGDAKRRPLAMDQLTALLEEAAKHSSAAVALIWLMLSGCRVSESCSAEIVDLDDESITVTVKGGYRETKSLDPPARRAVSAAVGDRTEGPILINPNTGQRLTRKKAWEMVRDLAKQAGIRRPVTDHELRNTAASLAAAAGASVEEINAMLGHRSLETTRLYMLDRSRSELAAKATRRVGEAITRAMGEPDDEEAKT